MKKRKIVPKVQWYPYDKYRFGAEYSAFIEVTGASYPNERYRARVKPRKGRSEIVKGEFETSGGARAQLLKWVGDNWPVQYDC